MDCTVRWDEKNVTKSLLELHFDDLFIYLFIQKPSGGPKILTYVTKVTIQFVQVLFVLLMLKPHTHILLQVGHMTPDRQSRL